MPFKFTNKSVNEKNFLEKLREQLNENFVETGAYVVEQSRNNAPIINKDADVTYEDTLSESIKGQVVKDNKGIKHVVIQSTHPAAAAKHELVETVRREQTSLEFLKASKSETGGVGTKYVERAITQSTEKTFKHIIDGLVAYFDAKRKTHLVAREKIKELITDEGS